MSYVLVGILVLLLVGFFITFMVMQATKKSEHATATDSDDAAPGQSADDAPLGDTEQHAGQQPGQDGFTAGGQDATGSGQGSGQDRPDGRFQRDPVGGEAEARPFTAE